MDSHGRLDLRCETLARDDSNEGTGKLDDIRLDRRFARPLYEVSNTKRRLLPLFLRTGKYTGKKDRHDALNSLGSRESSDMLAGRTSGLDGSAERNDEIFQLVLVDGLDKVVECLPSRIDDGGDGVVEGCNEDADPVDAIFGRIGGGDLAEGAEYLAGGSSARLVLVLRPEYQLCSATRDSEGRTIRSKASPAGGHHPHPPRMTIKPR
jgi:hypothetical protein